MILNVYKEKNMTSRDVVNILNKYFNIKKIGHTGTLDPIATGVLVCLIGNDTKLVNIITANKKEYIATMKLGVKTDTLDITGNIIEKKDYKVDKEKIVKVLNSFLGESMQEVPKYSAIKINGKKLYEYARENINIQLPKRTINIYDIELLEYNDDTIKFRVIVSKGTYIRSLINDIANKLNTVAVMSDLIRTKQGIFTIEESNKINDILNGNYKEVSYEKVFSNYEKIDLSDEDYFKVKNGSIMPINFNNDEVIYTYKRKYIAIYEKINNEAKIKLMFN
ncbi:MAG: tRNA pseudouridine(55) synthase TruB [Bacilli bacterium]|nr:tRNA pseudouridine(55) synthase TruB [Bacilli bacterium]